LADLIGTQSATVFKAEDDARQKHEALQRPIRKHCELEE
jgi:hypothetical protein